jgi:hypothetical protein
MLDVQLSTRFGQTAANWADNLMEEIGDKDEQAIRDFIDKAVMPEMVGDVLRACEREGIKNADLMQIYAKHAVGQFDRRLNQLLAQRQPKTIH